METTPFTNRQRILRPLTAWTLGLGVLLGIAGLIVPSASLAVPNTGGTQKTEKQCKDDSAKCNKDCDQLIDIDNNIKRCKDRCTDTYLMCLPLRSSSQPGARLKGVRPPVLPGQNTPIMPRGVEGEPSAGPPGQEEKAPAPK